MLPHAGTDSGVWREVVELGDILTRLAEVTGSVVDAEVAIVFDWQAWWATDLDSHPSVEVRYLAQVHAAYNALLGASVTVDIVAPGASLAAYKLVVVPSLYSVTDAAAQTLADFVAAGGHTVVTFFSGIVDEHDREGCLDLHRLHHVGQRGDADGEDQWRDRRRLRHVADDADQSHATE
jgi:beta-galactosidase